MFRARLCFFFLFFLAGTIYAEDSGWVLAAEKFKSVNMPAVYESLSAELPRLLLSSVLSVSSHSVLSDERRGRDLSALSDRRTQLIQERSSMVLARDKILLSPDSDATKRKNAQEATKKIKEQEKKISDIGKKISNFSAIKEESGSPQDISAWESGLKLYSRAQGVSLRKSLSDSKISALITGTVEDLSGYLHVSVSLETGIDGIPPVIVEESCPYDELEVLVSAITTRLVPGLSGMLPVNLAVSVIPENADIFIDAKRVQDISAPLTVFAGKHTIAVSSPGYLSASRTYDFSGKPSFRVSINLEKQQTVSVAFDTGEVPLKLYFHTQYVGDTPLTANLPRFVTIGEATGPNDIKTFFLIDPAIHPEKDSIAFHINSNAHDTAKRIDKRRKIFYYSLAGLYFSLPVAMITYGVTLNKYTAYSDGKLQGTERTVNEINNWNRAAIISRGVSIGLGINAAIQLFRYILAAEQAVPKEAELITTN